MSINNRVKRRVEVTPIAALLAAAAHLCACSVVLPPGPDDWTAHGVIVVEGKAGEWDDRFHPGIHAPATATRLGERILLYYVAADGDRDSDGGPKRRSVGLVSSSDGLKFSKHADNPVATYFPTPEGCNAEEEGIWRPTAALHGGTGVILYFGGIRQTSCRGSVQSDIMLVTSGDGRSFNGPTLVLSAADAPVWGSGGKGAEIFPAAAYEHDNEWYLFYVSKEASPPWSLGLARGSQEDRLTATEPILMADETSLGIGTRIRSASVAALEPGTYALFLELVNPGQRIARIEVRTFDPADPQSLGEPDTVYEWRGAAAKSVSATVALDAETDAWYLYYLLGNDGIRLMTAPALGSRTRR